MSNDQYRTIKIHAETHPKLRLLAAMTGESIVDLIDRLITREHKNMITQPRTDARQNKIDVMVECLEALKRGVQEPTIVRNDDGTFEYIPGAYLSDASYTGSRDVVTTVGYDGWGDFDPDTATDDELHEAAEWAADDWDWTAE